MAVSIPDCEDVRIEDEQQNKPYLAYSCSV